jgi:HSP20 family protein
MSLRHAMDRSFEDSFVRPSSTLTTLGEDGVSALDVYQTANEVVVKASLPGVKPEDVSIDISGETLTINGESKAERKIEKDDCLYQERPYGTFPRSVDPPGVVKRDKADGTMEDGF